MAEDGHSFEWCYLNLKRHDLRQLCLRPSPKRFQANVCNGATKLKKLQTVLESEALAELAESEQKYYTARNKIITKKLLPMGFIPLEEFHTHKLLPEESPSLIVYEMKRLLFQAILTLTLIRRISPVFELVSSSGFLMMQLNGLAVDGNCKPRWQQWLNRAKHSKKYLNNLLFWLPPEGRGKQTPIRCREFVLLSLRTV